MPVPPVGARIREERLKRGVTLRALARAVGVSASMVSQIETGKSQPSVSTLYAITQSLGISIEDVFNATPGDIPPPEPAPPAASPVPQPAAAPAMVVTVPSPGPEDAAPLPAAPHAAPVEGAGDEAAADGKAVSSAAAETLSFMGPLLRSGEREVLELESGVTWERLGHVPGTNVDFLLVTYAPGGSSSGSGKLMRHGGVEHGYLLEGELTLTLGFETHRMRPGDSVSFPSATPHRYHNEGDVPAVGVWFVHDTETPWPPAH
ncbi:XRE family transcriptional regulator [Actinomadura sp. NPDC047616]|uniref:helix-turn-helix domain-containing protein n=1 Tax=Actinomadura sp. NPDC047616 TaxID=3155914 RepID=UPI0033F6E2F6